MRGAVFDAVTGASMASERIEIERIGFANWTWAALDLLAYRHRGRMMVWDCERGSAYTRQGAFRQARRAYRREKRRAASRETLGSGES